MTKFNYFTQRDFTKYNDAFMCTKPLCQFMISLENKKTKAL